MTIKETRRGFRGGSEKNFPAEARPVQKFAPSTHGFKIRMRGGFPLATLEFTTIPKLPKMRAVSERDLKNYGARGRPPAVPRVTGGRRGDRRDGARMKIWRAAKASGPH